MNSRALSLTDVLAAMALVVVLLLVAVPLVTGTKEGGHLPKCSSNLRQLGLAALAYADDHRFFPHVGSLRALDGDWTSRDSLRVYVALLYFGYVDSPDVFVCGSSEDAARPMGSAQLKDRRLWTFGATGKRNPDAEFSPLAPGKTAGIQSTLMRSSEVSYGWTRRPMNRNASSNWLISADRALRVAGTPRGAAPGVWGNHDMGWNVVRVDASTAFFGLRHDRGDGTESFDFLGATAGRDDGHLAMEWAGANPLGKKP